mmetsp:Transcript_126390/g.236219  ORF Transcript_126390/g.236219 Transcript_126390/m.236219 type:complete len:240 (+) Transcript_126390:46-765(+)
MQIGIQKADQRCAREQTLQPVCAFLETTHSMKDAAAHLCSKPSKTKSSVSYWGCRNHRSDFVGRFICLVRLCRSDSSFCFLANDFGCTTLQTFFAGLFDWLVVAISHMPDLFRNSSKGGRYAQANAEKNSDSPERQGENQEGIEAISDYKKRENYDTDATTHTQADWNGIFSSLATHPTENAYSHNFGKDKPDPIVFVLGMIPSQGLWVLVLITQPLCTCSAARGVALALAACPLNLLP